MSNSPIAPTRFRTLRRLWMPVAATGAGSAAIAAWFDEVVSHALELLGLLLLPVLAGVIYLMDILIFKSRTPDSKDIPDFPKRGARK